MFMVTCKSKVPKHTINYKEWIQFLQRCHAILNHKRKRMFLMVWENRFGKNLERIVSNNKVYKKNNSLIFKHMINTCSKGIWMIFSRILLVEVTRLKIQRKKKDLEFRLLVYRILLLIRNLKVGLMHFTITYLTLEWLQSILKNCWISRNKYVGCQIFTIW